AAGSVQPLMKLHVRAVVTLLVALALVGVGVLGVSVLGGDDREGGRQSRGARTGDETADPDGGSGREGQQVAASIAGGLPLGTVTVGAASDRCPGEECESIEVTCPGLSEPIRGTVATSPPTGSPRGLVMFFTGGPGKGWYSAEHSDTTAQFDQLRAEGFELVQVRWGGLGWLRAATGEQVGPAELACRPATVIKWVHDTRYQAPGLDPAPGSCGFCLTGNSGGASQIAYALTHYGLGEVVDALIPTSGPPHAQLAKGCLDEPGEEAYAYPPSAVGVIDSSYGALRSDGPCAAGDPAFRSTFDRDSVDIGGSDYDFPGTRVHFIVSPDDETVAVRARDLAERLRQGGSPWVQVQEVPEMGHDIQKSEAGMAALVAAILASP
ncbi:MAG TPA: hypothetical protein VM386_07315, partial [Acidimicrobiales bacterium]|nr:hypothetical protein [Acidimicrobiales bacterium]